MASDIQQTGKRENITQSQLNNELVSQRLTFAASHEPEELFATLNTTLHGLTEQEVDKNRAKYGSNKLTRGKKESSLRRLVKAFVNPFTGILIVLASVSTCTDIIWAAPGERDYSTVVIIVAMVLLSGTLRFVQETKSGNAAEKLLKMITTTTSVERQGQGVHDVPLEEVVVGDIIHLSAGDMSPADIRILQAKDLFISQSALTGESEPVEKLKNTLAPQDVSSLTDCSNLAFMGSNIISGSAVGLVISTGDNTLFGGMAKSIQVKPPKTTFERGVNSVSWILIRFMLIMVPIVFFINGFTKHDWMDAFLFSITIAVGLTPEMLPMIVTTCLAKGAVSMSKEKTIIKNLNSIQDLGAMDTLCTDKTGTLTQDKVVLQFHYNIQGEEDVRVLRYAFLNSYYQTGLKNLMDISIIERTHAEEAKEPLLQGLSSQYTKVDEVPFDFERRRMSVVVSDAQGETQMITKGAVEEMLSICSFAEYNQEEQPMSAEIRDYIKEQVSKLNNMGMRVIGLAHKTDHSPVGAFSKQDECNMVFMGYLAFLDPPKESAMLAIKALNENGVAVKVLTGDNEKVTRSVCRNIGLPVDNIVLGSHMEKMDDATLAEIVEKTSVFAKLAPQQKTRIISILRKNKHSVGYMGDGVNDIAAMKAADVAISVDTAVDIAKETSSVILLEKDLMVLQKGLVEGRKTYANMIKYIKITASSNFGNVFSVLIASAFLPFLPMLSIHLILLNLIYDFSCTVIPWDNVDKKYLDIPRNWSATNLGRFMVWFGPTSSVFDISTYLLMYFVICPAMCGGLLYHQITDPAMQLYYIALFQTGWFVESMWTQTLIIHTLRTPKIPFLQSRASLPLTLTTVMGIVVLTLIPFTPLGRSIGLTALPTYYFAWLVLTVLMYVLLTTGFKHLFIKRYGELL